MYKQSTRLQSFGFTETGTCTYVIQEPKISETHHKYNFIIENLESLDML